jgi:hypothetical protein
LESHGERPVGEEEELLENVPFYLLFPSAKKLDTCHKVSGCWHIVNKCKEMGPLNICQYSSYFAKMQKKLTQNA